MTKPTLEEVEQVIVEKGLPPTEAEAFFEYHEQRGWKVVHGKSLIPMTSWKMAVNTWVRGYHKGTYGTEARPAQTTPAYQPDKFKQWYYGHLKPFKFAQGHGVQIVEGGPVYRPLVSPAAKKAVITGIVDHFAGKNRDIPPDIMMSIEACRGGRLSTAKLLASMDIGRDIPQVTVLEPQDEYVEAEA